MNRVLMSKYGPALAGTIIGVIAALLVKFGNPGNMGVCVACFTRDVAGALGLHRAGVVQYLRPELAGFILGSFGSALLYREYRPRGGSSPMIRFGLGFFAMVGALVFLGCPWRAYLRLAGGDLTAVAGIAGLTTGIAIGIMFLYRGSALAPHVRIPRLPDISCPAGNSPSCTPCHQTAFWSRGYRTNIFSRKRSGIDARAPDNIPCSRTPGRVACPKKPLLHSRSHT